MLSGIQGRKINHVTPGYVKYILIPCNTQFHATEHQENQPGSVCDSANSEYVHSFPRLCRLHVISQLMGFSCIGMVNLSAAELEYNTHRLNSTVVIFARYIISSCFKRACLHPLIAVAVALDSFAGASEMRTSAAVSRDCSYRRLQICRIFAAGALMAFAAAAAAAAAAAGALAYAFLATCCNRHLLAMD